MTVVNPHSDCNSGATPLFAMVGDEHQLNSRVFNPSTALKVSLFERLSKGPAYASHPLARGNKNERELDRPMIHPPFVNLTRNYRSHPAILALPSATILQQYLDS